MPISKNEVKVFPDPNRARSAAGQGEEADAAPRSLDSTRQGFGGLIFGRERLAGPGTRAALSDPQPSLAAAPELLVLPGAAQHLTNPQSARSKPKGCHSCPGPQPLEPPERLLYSWVLSAQKNPRLGDTGSLPRVPHTAWQGEGRVQAAAPTELSTLSTLSTLSPGSSQLCTECLWGFTRVFPGVRPAMPSARAQGHKAAAPRFLCSPWSVWAGFVPGCGTRACRTPGHAAPRGVPGLP